MADSHWKKPNVPIAVERELAALRKRVGELEAAGKKAHDAIADVCGHFGSSFSCTTTGKTLDDAFAELVRVLYGIERKPDQPRDNPCNNPPPSLSPSSVS